MPVAAVWDPPTRWRPSWPSSRKRRWGGSQEAAKALGMIGPAASEAIPALEKMVEDFFAGDNAREALLAIRGEAAAG